MGRPAFSTNRPTPANIAVCLILAALAILGFSQVFAILFAAAAP